MDSAQWNQSYPSGTRVAVTLADRAIVWTRAASASDTWGGMSHLRVEAIERGYVPLAWMQPIESAA